MNTATATFRENKTPETLFDWRHPRQTNPRAAVQWPSASDSPAIHCIPTQGHEAMVLLLDITEAFAQFQKQDESAYSQPFVSYPIQSADPKPMMVLYTKTALTLPGWQAFIDIERDVQVSKWIRMTSAAGCLSTLAKDVRDFLADHELLQQFTQYLNLAISSFDNAEFNASLQKHPEQDAVDWIELAVVLSGESAAVMEQYRAFLRSSSREIPSEALRYFRLSPDIR